LVFSYHFNLWNFFDFAGTSLPGILAAKMGASVILSEYSLNSEAIERCRKQATLNNVSVEIAGIMWGKVTWDLLQLPALDYILLADVFYEPAHFTDILFTIKFLLERYPSTKCYLTYQIRDEDWNILFLLQTFGLKCEKIPLDGFGAAGGDIAGSSLPGSVDVDLFLCKRVDVEPF
jgi:methyltransferase-like protein 23